MDEQLPPAEERKLSKFWRDGGGGAISGAFGAIDEIFNPGAVRAREQLKADHERVVPVPSPGDDALRSGKIVIRLAAPEPKGDAL